MLEREWRFWRQRPWHWRAPYLLIHAASALGLVMLVVQYMAHGGPDPQDIFPYFVCFAFAAHFFTGGGAVSVVAGEVQAGSLHLLTLTGLRPVDLVIGQFVGGLAVSAWGVLGLLPWLYVGWLNSALGIAELGWALLLWILVGTTFHAGLLFWASMGKTMASGLFSGLVPLAMYLAWPRFFDGFGAPRALTGAGGGVLWLFGGLAVATLLALGAAVWRLGRAESEPFRERESRSKSKGPLRDWWIGGRRLAGRRRTELLDRNPIEWQGSARTAGWAWCVVLGGLGIGLWNARGSADMRTLFTAVCVTRALLLVLLSFQAYGQVRLDISEGTWEPLMRTSVTPNSYLAGQWKAWWRQQRAPLLVLGFLPAGLAAFGLSGTVEWREMSILLFAGVLLTAGDAALAGVWFLGAALKLDGARFYYAALLAAGILGLMQFFHAFLGPGGAWAWWWAAISAVLFLLSRKACQEDLIAELAQASGRADSRFGWLTIR